MRLFHLHENRVWLGVLLLAGLGSLVFAGMACAADPALRQNRLLSVAVDAGSTAPTVKIEMEKPVGYRYTIYDSADPVRVVIDMPGMDVAAIAPQQMVGGELLSEIWVSSFALTSGTLGRVELLLARSAEYNVEVTDREMRIVFSGKGGIAQNATASAPAKVDAEPANPNKPAGVATESLLPGSEVPVAPVAQQNSGPAKYLLGINILPGSALLQTDGAINNLKYFTLKSPNRLVIDLYGVKPSFKERSFTPVDGFSKVRIGIYRDKIRLVFDAGKKKLPANWVESFANVVQVSWGKKKDTPPIPVMAAANASAESPAGSTVSPSRPVTGKVVVENVEFKIDGGKSLVLVTLSAPGNVTTPVVDGDLIRFDVKNAEASRGLRRVIDTMSFPSAVRQVTPYLVREGGRQDVRFAVQVKGVVPFELKSDDKIITLLVDNQGYTEVTPAAKETRELPLPESDETVAADTTDSTPVGEILTVPAAGAAAAASPVVTVAGAGNLGERKYSGQKITLVFDNADIRNILQLIAEVSDMNIVASDDVKGNVTLRLVDVPWDQALDLVLEIKGLGKMEEGNVVRVLPAKEMRALALERLKDQSAIELAEPIVTKVFSVRFAPVEDMAKKIEALIGSGACAASTGTAGAAGAAGTQGGGSVTFDTRTRQIIVTARPSKLREIEEFLLKKLDVPERQVMIEARIVQASDKFSRKLGVNWRVLYDAGLTGPGDLANAVVTGGGNYVIDPSFITAGLANQLQFGRLGIDTTVLDLRLSALETAGAGRVVSTPRIATMNGAEASINQGTEIPYTTIDKDGVAKTEFRKAELSLKVTPVINPGNTLSLEIDARNDALGAYVPMVSGSAPSIDTKQAKTRVLVQDGETTVIGGIYIDDESTKTSGVPLLQHIPLLGHLFKSTETEIDKQELLIFITPRILE